MLIRQIRNRPARRGFTLLEILLVVGILVALAAILAPNLLGAQATANNRNAKLLVQKFEGEFQKYNVFFGTFPTTDQGFQALIQPAHQAEGVNWSKPISSTEETKDPWGTPLNYAYPSSHGQDKPDIWSNGPDKQSGTQDDVVNWPKN